MSASNRLPLQPLKHASRASVTVAAAAASSDILGTSRSTSKPSWLCPHELRDRPKLYTQEMVIAALNDLNAAGEVDANHDALVEPSKIVASTSDHECGGLPLGLERPKDKSEAGYMWYPDVVLSASHRVPGCRLSQIPFLRHPLSV
ncbi:hypothetical protein A4X13_0g1560 [Tilletia indica]|uniref:Uncharacterized protein n=1 Tax=Tilletia indica TaxID=43049 RepID=A0A8T8TD78_9BASI|nr:hypothetical protein A4X13_0g1560 [Tilletia indica]